MKRQVKKCSICGGKILQKKITYTQAIGEKIFIVSDVPAEVCSQCGEQYLTPDTVDAIQEALETGKKPSSTLKVPVFRFPQ